MTKPLTSASERQLHRRFKKSLLFIAGLAIALLLAEGALRVFGFSHFNPYIADQYLGFSLRPNAEGWWRKEGLTYIKINSQGFRDREHTIEKPGDTIRIAVLGDSFAEAFQVPLEKTFWTVMQQQLQESAVSSDANAAGTNRKIEVLNFGVSGFSTARELILLRQRVWQYSPDIVLLLVTTRNDVRDNSSALDPYASSGLPYFVYREGSLQLDDSRLQARNHSLSFRVKQSLAGRALNYLRTHSRLVGLLDATREAYEWRNTSPDKYGSNPNEAGLDDEVFRPPVNTNWEEAWNVTEKLIVQMREEVKARSAKFLVVTGSTGIQVHPDNAVRAAYMKELGVATLFYPDLRFKALGDREHFEVLTLAPLLLDYASRNQVLLHGAGKTQGKGHWNETGHRVAGELIAQRLSRLRWLETDR